HKVMMYYLQIETTLVIITVNNTKVSLLLVRTFSLPLKRFVRIMRAMISQKQICWLHALMSSDYNVVGDGRSQLLLFATPPIT
ncbi:hypothetical protein ACT691_04185, partial [Vibrio metschnikovii]